MSASHNTHTNKFRNYHISFSASGIPLEIPSYLKYSERLLLGFDPDRKKLVSVEVCEINAGESIESLVEGGLETLRSDVEELRNVSHPAFVSVIEVGEDDGVAFAVRECVSGETLEAYMRRVGRKLPFWNTLDLGLQLVDVLEALDEKPRLAAQLDPARSVLSSDFGGRLRLRMDGFVLNRRGQKAPANATPSELVRKVCDFLHFIFCGRWVPVDSSGRSAPLLGELPESMRYLVWAAFQKNAAQGSENLDELKAALRRIQNTCEARPLAMAFQPLCRLRQHTSGPDEIERMFGKKYRLEAGSNPMGDEFLPTGHEQRMVQHPFGYSKQLHAVPAGRVIGDRSYAKLLEQLDSPRNVSHRHVLRACDQVEKEDLFFVVEETINGFSLEELCVRRGGFDIVDAKAIAKHVHEAMKEVEEGGRWMWDLSAENTLVHFESRLSGEELVAAIDRPVANWPTFKIVLRLHPTMSSLIRGSAIPEAPAMEEGALDLDMRAHTGRSLAALLWKLLSFNPYVIQPLPNGVYRKLQRLTDEGNDLLKDFIEDRQAGVSETESREKLIKALAANESIGSEQEQDEAEMPYPFLIAPVARVQSGSDSRRLCEEARDRVNAQQKKPGIVQRLKGLKQVSLKELKFKKVAFHASMAALICGLAVVSFLFLNTSTRPKMVSVLGSIIDKVLGVEASATEPDVAIESAHLPVPPMPSASELIPVVMSTGTATPLMTSVPVSTCVPLGDTALVAANTLSAETLNETVILPNQEMAVTVLDEILGQLRHKQDNLKDNEELLLKAAGSGSLEALVMLGDLLKISDTPRAVIFYERASMKGHLGGMNAVADCMWNGIGMEQDRVEALRMFVQAADAGNLEALETLGQLHVQGLIPEGATKLSRVDILKMGAESGSGRSAASLGVLYLNGLSGLEKDPAEAAQYFEKAALAGSVDGMLYFARCLHSGIGMTPNQTASRHWFEKAAKAGNEAAQTWCRQNSQ